MQNQRNDRLSCTLAMPSYTYAKKAEGLLRQRSKAVKIVRREQTSVSGCGYDIVVSGNCQAARAILDRASVPYTEVSHDS
ncbi:MAG: hypothetical protein II690_06450 [Ruminococcus sp.]|nr:hypothetical protein [Ruminococcus sp.]MBQ3916214.1 hypothetical protein [Ruminococcus sp.]